MLTHYTCRALAVPKYCGHCSLTLNQNMIELSQKGLLTVNAFLIVPKVIANPLGTFQGTCVLISLT